MSSAKGRGCGRDRRRREDRMSSSGQAVLFLESSYWGRSCCDGRTSRRGLFWAASADSDARMYADITARLQPRMVEARERLCDLYPARNSGRKNRPAGVLRTEQRFHCAKRATNSAAQGRAIKAHAPGKRVRSACKAGTLQSRSPVIARTKSPPFVADQ